MKALLVLTALLLTACGSSTLAPTEPEPEPATDDRVCYYDSPCRIVEGEAYEMTTLVQCEDGRRLWADSRVLDEPQYCWE